MNDSDERSAKSQKINLEKEAAYRRIVSDFPTIRITITSHNGKVIAEWIGKNIADIYGYETAELEADPELRLSIIHPADRKRVLESRRNPAQRMHTIEEYRIYRKDGQMRWVADECIAVSVQDEELILSIDSITDITTKKTNEQLEINFKELVDRTQGPITVRDLTGKMLYCNTAAAKLFDYSSAEELVGTNFEDVLSPDSSKEFREQILPHLVSGPWSSEVTLTRKDGKVIYVNTSTNLFQDSSGQPVAFYSILTDISHIKETETALRANEELLRRRYDAISAGVMVFCSDSKIIYVNRTAVEILKTTPEQILGTTAANPIWHVIRKNGEPFPVDEQPVSITLRTGQPTRNSVVGISCGDFTENRWLLINSEPVIDPTTSSLVEVLVTFLDITESIRIQEALKESEEKYRSLVDNIDAHVFRIDRNMCPIAMAGNLVKILGYTADEFTRHPSLWREVIHPDDIGKAWELMQMAENAHSTQPFDIRVHHRTGETKWLQGTLTPVFDKADKLLFFDGVTLDVTRLKFAEESRRESEEKYRSLVDTADAVIFRLTKERNPIALFGRVAEISGYTISELIENPQMWKGSTHPDDAERVRAIYREIARTGERRAIESRIVHKSGSIRWIRTQVTPRYDDQGELIYFDGVGLDITESVEAQEREARRTNYMRILTKISQEFSSSLEAQQIIDTAAKKLCETLGDFTVVATFEQLSGRLLHLSICCPHDCEIENIDHAIRQPNLTINEIFGSEEINAGLIPDLRQISQMTARFVDAVEFSSGIKLGPAIIAPVASGTYALGILINARPIGQEFDQEDVWFATEVASHASASLVNAALYERQTRIAETLQRSLIPPEPKFDSLDIATLYAPASGEAEVGGDFLDVFRVDNNRIGLVVGDVSGKGLEAAIHTAEAKYMLRAFASQNPDPLYVITHLNRALYACLPDETFITLVYILIDTQGRAMTYVCAGHETSIVLCRDENTLKEIVPCGPMLGVTNKVDYKDGNMPLEPDDTLFCYTDGITEVRHNSKRFGYGRLRDTIAGAPPGDSRSLMEYIMEKVREFSSEEQADDQVVMVVRPLV